MKFLSFFIFLSLFSSPIFASDIGDCPDANGWIIEVYNNEHLMRVTSDVDFLASSDDYHIPGEWYTYWASGTKVYYIMDSENACRYEGGTCPGCTEVFPPDCMEENEIKQQACGGAEYWDATSVDPDTCESRCKCEEEAENDPTGIKTQYLSLKSYCDQLQCETVWSAIIGDRPRFSGSL